MAVKLEKTKTMSGDSRYSIKLTVTEKTVTSADIADNSTRVDYKLEATKSSGSGYYSRDAVSTVKVTLDGTTLVNTKKTYDFRNSTPKTITLASGTHTIKHDPDGSKTIACSGYFKDGANSLGNATVSGNLTLSQLHTPPVITGYSITETNSALTNIGVSNNQFVGYLSNKRINITYNLDEDTQYQSALVYFEGGSQIDWNNALPITVNFANFHPSPVNNNLNLCVSVTDDKNTTSYYSNTSGSTQTRQGLDSYAYVPYIIPTFNSSSNAKRDGQLTGKVKLNITGTYYNGEIGSGANKVNQGGTYKPTIKYKFWMVGNSQPSTYAYTIPPSSITISNGTFTISNYQIGSADEQATNHFIPQKSYRVKLYIQDTFKSTESPELSIPVGEAVWTEYKDRVDFKKLTIQNVEVTPGGGGAGDYENLINKPEINGVTLSGDKTASQLGFASVATSGSYNDLSNKPTIPTVNNATLTIQKNGTNVQTFTANASSNVTANITVPTKTSDLTNDDNVVKDASYVHTDNNYTTTEKNKLSGIASGAEVNVQANWAETNTSSDAYIKNKPTIPTQTSQLTNDSGFISSAQSTVGSTDRPVYLNNGTPTQTNTPVSGGWFKGVPFVTNAGVMEIGRYIDFHPTNDSSLDYSKRLDAGSGTTARTLTLPDKTGTIAITSDIPTKVSYLTNDSEFIPNKSTYVNTHPENNPVIIPFIHNDIAFLNQRGGGYVVKYDGTIQDQNINNVFDASPSYWSINPTGTTEIVIELTLHKSFGWTNTIYYDFGSSSWRAKNIKVEVMNSNYASDTWVTKQNLTNYGKGNGYITTSHTPVGASNAGAGFNKIRFTFSSWQTATGFRISQLGVYNYGSLGVRETYMSRGRDDEIYRNISPAYNNLYTLGTSSKKWNNVYATTFTGNVTGNLTGTASKATGDKNGNDITTTYVHNDMTPEYSSLYAVEDSDYPNGAINIVDAGYITHNNYETFISSGAIMYYKNGNHELLTDKIDSKQDTLIGTQTTGQNLKTINGVTLLGTGNITIGGGGTATDVQVNGTSITSGGVANLRTNSTYNSSSNKIATMSDVPSFSFTDITLLNYD